MTRSYANPRNSLLCGLALALAAAAPARALDSDKDKPLNVDADHFEGGMQQEVSVLTGNVHITQGTIIGTGARADIHQKESDITRVVLTGAPATFQQTLEGGGLMKGRARSIDYDTTAKHAVLTGDAVVEHPSGEARGEHLTYDVDTGKMSGDGQGGDGRVHLRMEPKSKDADAAKDKPDTDKGKAKEAPKKDEKPANDKVAGTAPAPAQQPS